MALEEVNEEKEGKSMEDFSVIVEEGRERGIRASGMQLCGRCVRVGSAGGYEGGWDAKTSFIMAPSVSLNRTLSGRGPLSFWPSIIAARTLSRPSARALSARPLTISTRVFSSRKAGLPMPIP